MSAAVPPQVLWAQRSNKTDASKNNISLLVCTPDINPESLKIETTSSSISFFAHSDLRKADYQFSIEFFKEIDETLTRFGQTSKGIAIHLQKKELDENYWPRLTKSTLRQHFLKTDFDLWVDQDEQDEKDGLAGDDFGNLGGMDGMPGMGDAFGAGGGFDDMDFSKLAGGLGESTGGVGADDDDIDVEDDDMPSLAGEDGSDDETTRIKAPAETVEVTEPTGKAKIEEVS